MNVIIPLGGKGERFLKQGYTEPKPLIKIMDKLMIEYVLDNLKFSRQDNVFIIYNERLESHNFSSFIKNKYPFITLIEITETKGAAETLNIGLSTIMKNYEHKDKCIVLDCDTFYTEDILGIFRNSYDNMIFYTKNQDLDPIYSYIEMSDDSIIINIKEKVKISDNANTGAYAFTDIRILQEFCSHVIENNITPIIL